MNETEILQKSIGQLLGYRVEPRDDLWMLIDPDGKRHLNFGADWAAWTAAPDWPNDANVALELLGDLPHRWMLSGTPTQGPDGDGDRYRCEIADPDNRSTRYGNTPALAICRAWLAWKEGEQS